MRSVVVLQSGELGKNVTISFWTNLSAALTAYECEGNNTKAVQQIDDSNTLLSDALSFDINEDLPLQITNLDTPAVKYRDLPTARYGIANAAVASYTLDIDIRNGGMVAHELYNSATLADLAYADILYDGFLKGVADTTVTMFGDVTLSADVYRTDIPNHMVAIINNFQSLPEGIDKKFLSGVASGFNGSSVPDLFGYGDITPLGANAKLMLRGVKVSSCSLTNVGSCCGSWTSGKETVYRSAGTVEFDVQDSFSSFEVTNITSSASGLELIRGLSSNVTENVRVAWRSGMKPVIEFSQDSTGVEIRSLNVEFTNDLGEKLIVTKTINSSNCTIN